MINEAQAKLLKGVQDIVARTTTQSLEGLVVEKSNAISNLIKKITSKTKDNPLKATINKLTKAKVNKVPVKDLTEKLSSNQIIQKLGSKDPTGGSCVSQALAYFANMLGLDVTDYRGGSSRVFFMKKTPYANALRQCGATVIVKKGSSSVKRGDLSLWASFKRKMETDKEYILGIGGHTAVVRKTEMWGYEYLELQSGTWNG